MAESRTDRQTAQRFTLEFVGEGLWLIDNEKRVFAPFTAKRRGLLGLMCECNEDPAVFETIPVRMALSWVGR